MSPGIIAALRDMADRIDRGPDIPLPPSVYSALIREHADDLAAKPRTWRLPPEPGPEVTAVRDRYGHRWRLRYAPPAGAWEPSTGAPWPESSLAPWQLLVSEYGPLADATEEEPMEPSGGA